MIDDDFVYNNEEESEMGQLHAIHLNMNAIADIRRKMSSGPSLEQCEECGEDIPKARQLAVAGCKLCIYCQELSERKKF
jgi:phage/conjugal plasmid C-4 type zinc finger TraR family protein